MHKRPIPLALILASTFVLPLTAYAATNGDSSNDPQTIRQQIHDLQQRLAKVEKTRAGYFKVGGALRYQYAYRDWSQSSRDQTGTLDFDTFRFNVDGKYKGIILSAEYRFYQGWNSLKSGWMGYDFTPRWQGQFGLIRVPFGILPYASHSFFFSSNYYFGLEDTYDAGVKAIYNSPDSPWDFRVAVLKNAGFGLFGSSDPGRYSYNVLPSGAQKNLADNTVATRLTYTLGNKGATTELGVSALAGQLYNQISKQNGSHWAAGLHADGNYGQWNVMAEVLRYQYNPQNPAGVNSDVVQVGAYNYYDLIPASADSGLVNVAYTVPVQWGPISSLKFYNDYTEVFRKKGGFPVTRMNVLGMAISAGKVYTYIDLVEAQNQPFIGGSMAPGVSGVGGDPTATTATDRSWNTRFNVNVGYYF